MFRLHAGNDLYYCNQFSFCSVFVDKFVFLSFQIRHTIIILVYFLNEVSWFWTSFLEYVAIGMWLVWVLHALGSESGRRFWTIQVHMKTQRLPILTQLLSLLSHGPRLDAFSLSVIGGELLVVDAAA